MENKMLWRGKDVREMTKDELIEALYEMSQLYDQKIEEVKRQLTATLIADMVE